MVEDEAILIIERVNGLLVTEATTLELAVAAGFNGGKARKALHAHIKSLSIKTGPRSAEENSIKWPPDDYDAGDGDNGWVPPEVED